MEWVKIEGAKQSPKLNIKYQRVTKLSPNQVSLIFARRYDPFPAIHRTIGEQGTFLGHQVGLRIASIVSKRITNTLSFPKL